MMGSALKVLTAGGSDRVPRQPHANSPVATAGNTVQPRGIIYIPGHCLTDCLTERQAGLPTKFVPDLTEVDRVAAVVARPIFHVGNQ